MRFVIACGGTGGHFYPGYALGALLRERGHEPLFVLRAGDPAGPRLSAEDLPFTELDLRGLPRGPSLRWLGFPFQVFASLRVARNILAAFRPAAAVGMGGYLTFPVAIAARLAGLPYVLHEANAVLGLANRVCAGGAVTLALGLPLEPPSGVRCIVTGTPVRRALHSPGDKREARRELGLDGNAATVLVFGGSQGARALNRMLPEALTICARGAAGLPSSPAAPGERKTAAPGAGRALQIIHLAGAGHEAEVRAAYATASGSPSAVVLGYMDRMDLAYAAADLVISRSGAGTVAELIAQKKPALLIPYPAATARHQEANARILTRCGAAAVMLEDGLTAAALAAQLSAILSGSRALRDMALGYDALDLPAPQSSAQALVDIVEQAGKPLS